MPRIRQYTQEVGAGGVLPQTRSATAADFGGGVADALGDFGHTLDKINAHIEGARRDTLLSGATAKASQEIQEYAYTLQHGTVDEDGTIVAPPDPGQHYKLYQDKVEEVRKRYGGTFGEDAQLRTLFDRDLSKVALQQSFHVRTNAINRQKQMAVAELNDTEDTLADIYARGDDFVRKQVIEQYRGQVARFAAAGIIDPVDAGKRSDKFMTMAERATAREMIRNDPAQALDAFLKGDVFTRMPPDERMKFTELASQNVERRNRADIAEQERLRRETERKEKEVQQQTYKDAMDLAVSGKLTARWVQSNRDRIAKEDYDNLLKIAVKGGGLGGGEGTGNKAVYSDLRIRAGKGEDVRTEATKALAGGSINAQQFSGIVGEVEANSPTARAENWFRNGRDYIMRSLAPSQINPGIDREVQARALEDWSQFAAQNPNATAAERERARDSIVNSSRIIQSDQVVTSIPTPRYLVGQKMAPNIGQTVAKTEEEFKAGRMTRTEFDREMRNIRDLNEWAKRNAAAKPDQQKKSGK